MVCYSYKDTRLSVFRPAASRNLNPCCSWPEADTGSSHSISTYMQHWDLPGTSGQGRGGEGRACYQSRETSQAPSQLILIFLGTNQQVLAESPSLLPSIDTLVSTAALSASHYLASCKHGRQRLFQGIPWWKQKRLFSHKLLLFCRNFSWPCQYQAHRKYNNTWEMASPSPAEHPSAQETHPPE